MIQKFGILGAVLMTSTLFLGDAGEAKGLREMRQDKAQLVNDVERLREDVRYFKRTGQIDRYWDARDSLEIKELKIRQINRRQEAFAEPQTREKKPTPAPKLAWKHYVKEHHDQLLKEAMDSIHRAGTPQIAAKKAQRQDNFFEQLGQFALSELLEVDESAWPIAQQNFHRYAQKQRLYDIPPNSMNWGLPAYTPNGITSLKPYYREISRRFQSFMKFKKDFYEGKQK